MSTKDKVLTFLEANRGQHISGTKMAEELDISRNAVWKAIKQLEKDGFKIDAVTNKGYSLLKENNQLSEIGIRENLGTNFKDSPIHYFSTIDSTNKKAKELALEGATHGTLVVANEQTKGKGRYGRQFESPEDTGIYMSMILKPEELFLNDPTLITAYAAVIVSKVLESLTGKQIGIKWVNDLFYENKKVCGILTEAVTDFESGQIEWIVLGIGINLSTSETTFSKEVREKAGSIFNTSETNVSRNFLVAKIYEEIVKPSEELSVDLMMQEYKSRSIVLNKQVIIQQGSKTYEVLIKDIDQAGQLVIETKEGETKTFNSGEIRIMLN
ncbi:biotin--[acetyl-CoA-carboxylase] ligase [Vagococcus carniphilus]|uniref:biotin--[acetyl-CoA-carboxylase] ligase n=1 Tax=Vagococcus carniphilus TaxID=218144 RepID=UPI00288D7C3F|nr:biotin--[acetyl-CoA-carboxylase] ligase [Vagococcus carniphilus]MDT2847972.1 biotin--[acetyl-CoA-carboxylase] ligase [Vagococcus carniphilus]